MWVKTVLGTSCPAASSPGGAHTAPVPQPVELARRPAARHRRGSDAAPRTSLGPGSSFLLAVLLVIAARSPTCRSSASAGSSPGTCRTASTPTSAAESEDPATSSNALADHAERDGLARPRAAAAVPLLAVAPRRPGAIRYRPSVTTTRFGACSARRHSTSLPRTFEAVAYGGRDAAPPDLEAARREWPRVVADASKRRATDRGTTPTLAQTGSSDTRGPTLRHRGRGRGRRRASRSTCSRAASTARSAAANRPASPGRVRNAAQRARRASRRSLTHYGHPVVARARVARPTPSSTRPARSS